MRTLIAFLILPFLSPPLLAGTTGTLAGYVRDGETGQPLSGASVILEGTGFRVMTDKQGFYIINIVPAGTYIIRAEMVGYATIRRPNVVVLPDLRTTINFELSSMAVTSEKEVVMPAECPPFPRDATASVHFVEGAQLERLPLDTFQEAVLLQPGVVAKHIRGGRMDEVLYLVDGIPWQDPIFGICGGSLPNGSIVNLVVQTGGFSAEYGGALSGIVNLITRSGGDDHRFWYRNSGDIVDFDHYIRQEMGGGGPLSDFGNYFIFANLITTDTRYRQRMRRFFPSPISIEVDLHSKLAFRLDKSTTLTLQGLFACRRWRQYQHRWKYNLDGLAERRRQALRLDACLTYVFNPLTFCTFSISHHRLHRRIPGEETTEYVEPKLQDPDDPRSWIIEGTEQWNQSCKEVINVLKFDFVKQVNPVHEIKTGLEFTYYDLYMRDIKYAQVPIDSIKDLYTYTVIQNKYRHFPLKGAIYLQDKAEYRGLVANVGLRLDFFHPRARRPPIEYPTKDVYEKYHHQLPRVKGLPKIQISPRIGLRLPITNKDFLRLNYGWFFQTPPPNLLYTGSDADMATYWPLIGNPDLKQKKSIAYEIGYRRILSKSACMGLTVFDKNVTNLANTQTMALADTLINGSLCRRGLAEYDDSGHAHIWGIELFLEKRYSGFISGWFSYTYMKATGSASSPVQGYNRMIWGLPILTGWEYPLDWDQRHTFVINIDLRRKDNWGLNLLFRLYSPLPYTRAGSQGINNERMKWRSYFDLKFNKSFRLFNRGFAVYLEILNLFDRKNLLWVDNDGRPGGYLHDPSAYDIGRRIRAGFGIGL